MKITTQRRGKTPETYNIPEYVLNDFTKLDNWIDSTSFQIEARLKHQSITLKGVYKDKELLKKVCKDTYAKYPETHREYHLELIEL